jgi:hypothetical protein
MDSQAPKLAIPMTSHVDLWLALLIELHDLSPSGSNQDAAILAQAHTSGLGVHRGDG